MICHLYDRRGHHGHDELRQNHGYDVSESVGLTVPVVLTKLTMPMMVSRIVQMANCCLVKCGTFFLQVGTGRDAVDAVLSSPSRCSQSESLISARDLVGFEGQNWTTDFPLRGVGTDSRILGCFVLLHEHYWDHKASRKSIVRGHPES